MGTCVSCVRCKLTFNDNVLGCPLLVEGGEARLLTDADNMLPKIKVFSVEAEQAEPQLPHRLSVLLILWPATGLQVEEDRCGKGAHDNRKITD